MKLVLATPLFPPDVEEQALYVKECASRLAAGAQVTVITYGRIPEPVSGVTVVAIDKSASLPIRMVRFLVALVRHSKDADHLIAENGPSVELPVLVSRLFRRTPLVFHTSDTRSVAAAQKSLIRGTLQHLVRAGAQEAISTSPLPRPAILPFDPYPTEAFESYERSWEAHMHTLNGILYHD